MTNRSRRQVVRRKQEPITTKRRVVRRSLPGESEVRINRVDTTISKSVRRQNPESILISSVLNTGNHQLPMLMGITPDWMHTFDDEWRWISRYIERHGKTPSTALFLNRFSDFQILDAHDVEWAVDAVRESHTRHVVLEIVGDTASALRERKRPASVVDDLSHRLLTLQSQMDGTSNEIDVLTEWEHVYNEVHRRALRTKDTGIAGIPTGFQTLDDLTGGPQAGDYWVIAARLGQGKTWTMIRMAMAALYTDHRVQYDALEQTRTQVAMRMHAFMSSAYGRSTFKAMDLMSGSGFDLRHYRRFLRSMPNQFQNGAMFVNDTARGKVNPLTIAAQIERNRPAIVFIDYLTLMDNGDNDWRGVAKLSADMKGIATRYKIPIVVAAQINRMGMGSNKPPGPEALAGADAIGQDADCVVTMLQQSRSVMALRLAKYRHGRDGDIWYARFKPNTGDYEEIGADEAERLKTEDAVKD